MDRYPRLTGPNAAAAENVAPLDAVEAYDAMRTFLEAYWERGEKSSRDLRLLLSSLEGDTNIRPDGFPLDPAIWDDWLEAIRTVRDAKV